MLCAPYIVEEIIAELWRCIRIKPTDQMVEKPTRVAELRPIALCNVLYKICSKAIAKRLKVLDFLISPFQNAFILGRLITDNALIANEVSHYIHNCQSSIDGVFSLKLDMSKDYDRMEWSFPEAVLLRLVFTEQWVHLIMQCVSTVKYSFLISGHPKGNLLPSRGLKQGSASFIFLIPRDAYSVDDPRSTSFFMQ